MVKRLQVESPDIATIKSDPSVRILRCLTYYSTPTYYNIRRRWVVFALNMFSSFVGFMLGSYEVCLLVKTLIKKKHRKNCLDSVSD